MTPPVNAGVRRNHTGFVRVSLLSVCVLAFGCTSVPETIRQPVQGPAVKLVQQQSDRHLGATVRWGGTLAEVHNGAEATELIIVSRRLDQRGQPVHGGYLGSRSKYTGGRFIARVPGFLDPLLFKPGVDVTVVGTIKGVDTRNIGEYAYVFPIIDADAYHPWEQYKRADSPYYGPYFVPVYRPYYDPFLYWFVRRPYRPYGFHYF